jgi:hypothetical protein
MTAEKRAMDEKIVTVFGSSRPHAEDVDYQ